MSCSTCPHHGVKASQHESATGGVRGPRLGHRELVGQRHECVWFWSAAGKRADSSTRLSVIVAEGCGGTGCPVYAGLLQEDLERSQAAKAAARRAALGDTAEDVQ